MDIDDAVALIAAAVGDDRGVWADLGAGSGTFTRALASILAPGSRIYAVDRDARAVAQLRRVARTNGVAVIPVHADFTRAIELPELGDALLDGILLANALHFVADAESLLMRLVKRVRLGGRVVLVEYDQRAASRWVPYPISASRWQELTAATGLSRPAVTATRASDYSGVLYAAGAHRIV